MNRSMVWTVIARLAGQTIGGITWAEDAFAWAVTRAEAATILARIHVLSK